MNAYKDKASFKLTDIPLHFQNMHCLRANWVYSKKEINLHTTSPVTVFIAFHKLKPNPL